MKLYGLDKNEYVTRMEQKGLPFNEHGIVDIFELDLNETMIPEELVFLLGDTSWRSIDSKDFGPISNENIIGRVLGYKE